jgi:biofilm PGA synthesis N-glycosyltransferase PgaC
MKEYDVSLSWYDIIVEMFFNGLYIYSVTIMASYLILALISYISVKKYLHKNHFVDYNKILNSPVAPSVSILAPAYNEEETIIDNVKSLLSIHYSKMEVIIINDGSKDKTLERCIEAFDLERVNFAVEDRIPTKEIRDVYKSRNKAYRHLVVVDKLNGGKSDALNAGTNVSSMDYITCIDVDCVLDQSAILKMMKPFLDETDHEVIATGGVVRIANSCEIKDGRLIEVNVPNNLIARSQTLEYLRAFLLGRMAWSLFDGLILISGAIGIFKKQIVIEVGGYDHNTVGEDMELVVRMRRYMIENKRKYKVAFVPDPLCWTEAPESFKILGRQRNRWTRGTIETLLKHKKMFFNPKYKLIGMLSYPYWFFFEWLAPLLESFGIMLFFLFAITGLINWSFFFLMIFLVYGFTICFSVLALFVEEITYHQYKKHKDIMKLLFIGLLEPFVFHPFVVYSAIKGNMHYLRGQTGWGEMKRKGFTPQQAQGGVKKITVVEMLKNAPKAIAAPEMRAVRYTLGIIGFVAIAIVGIFYYVSKEEERSTKIKYDELAEKQEEVLERVGFEKMNSIENESKRKELEKENKAKLEEMEKLESAPKKEAVAKQTEKSTPKGIRPPITHITKPNTTTAPKTEQKPKETTSKPSPTAIPKAAPSKVESYKYHIISGSFTDEYSAQEKRQELKNKGYDSNIIQVGSIFRVTIGRFNSKDEAKKRQQQLQKDAAFTGVWVYEQD